MNKNGTLLCGCDVKIEDSIYLYRKTHGNRFFGVSSQKVKIEYKGLTLEISFSGHEEQLIQAVAYIYDNNEDEFEVKLDNEPIISMLPMYYKNWELRNLVHNIIVKGEKEIFSSNRNLIYIAVKKGLTEASSRDTPFGRCRKCEKHKGRRSCEAGHEWRSTHCIDFELRLSIKTFLEGKNQAVLGSTGWTVPPSTTEKSVKN